MPDMLTVKGELGGYGILLVRTHCCKRVGENIRRNSSWDCIKKTRAKLNKSLSLVSVGEKEEELVGSLLISFLTRLCLQTCFCLQARFCSLLGSRLYSVCVCWNESHLQGKRLILP